MYCHMITLLLLLVTVAASAEDRVFRIKADGDTLMLNSSGNWVPPSPYVLEPIEVWSARPAGPGDCFVTDGLFLAYDVDNLSWSRCSPSGDEDPEWESMPTPTIMILPGASLLAGDFISSDTQHKVEAVVDDLEIMEKWESVDKNGSSGTLTFSPKTSKNPAIGFNVTPPAEDGRSHQLSYEIKVKVSSLNAEETITQNRLNQLRQEYLDLELNTVPSISKFDQSSPAYPKLLDKPKDVHSHHTHWILTFINSKAQAVKGAYSQSFVFTSGYRCAGKNNVTTTSPNSKHIHGKALDFDAGFNNAANSKKNYDLYVIAKNSNVNATRRWLYDQDGNKITATIPSWPNLPNNVTLYTKGHMDW